MRIELVTIGDELLHGRTVNTNAATIGRRLVDAGFELSAQSTVPDEPASLEAHLHDVLARADVLITSGGLGPTVDDNTRDVLARLFGKTARRTDARVLAHLKKRYRRRPWKPVLNQARVPVGAAVLLNAVGTAPGLIFRLKGKAAVALPGPPRELIPMLDRVVAFLKKFGAGRGVVASATLRTVGIRESVLDAELRKVFPQIPGLSYGLAADPFLVDIRLVARRRTEQAAQRAVAKGEKLLRRTLPTASTPRGPLRSNRSWASCSSSADRRSPSPNRAPAVCSAPSSPTCPAAHATYAAQSSATATSGRNCSSTYPPTCLPRAAP